MMSRPTENHELTQVSPSTKDTKGPRAQLDDLSQREYDDRVQLMRLGKKSVLKVRCQLNELCGKKKTYQHLCTAQL